MTEPTGNRAPERGLHFSDKSSPAKDAERVALHEAGLAWRRPAKRIATLAVAMAVATAVALPAASAIAEGAPSSSAPAAQEAVQASSYTKDQVIYVKSDASGVQQGVYAVNSFEAPQGGSVQDKGSYSAVTNLSDSQELASGGGSVSFTASADKDFVYQGDLDAKTQLPWSVGVSYKLDGKAVDPADLAGATGRLEMTLAVEPNPDCPDASSYTDGYLVQATGLLPSDKTRDLAAEGATVAQNGDDLQLTYMVLPSSEGTFTLSADVEDFSFDGWQVVGVPLSLALDVDPSSMDTSQLVELEDVAQANDGAQALRDGSVTLRDSLALAQSGAGDLARGAAEVDAGAQDVASGTGSLKAGADELSGKGGDLVDGSSSVADGIGSAAAGAEKLDAAVNGDGGLAQGADALAAGSSAYLSKLQGARSQVGSADTASAQAHVAAAMQAVQEAAASGGDVSAAMGELEAAVSQLAAASGNAGAANALDQAIGGYGDIDAGIQSLASKAPALSAGVGELDRGLSLLDSKYQALDLGIKGYTQGASRLAAGAGELDAGAARLADGTSALKAGADGLSAGADALADGAGTLTQGAVRLADGTQILADATRGLDGKVVEQVREQIEEALDPGYAPRDFVNGEVGGHMGRVQFVFKTGAVS